MEISQFNFLALLSHCLQEFKHPLEYLAKIRARAEPYGICRVVPPVTWRPPCPLKEDSPELQSMQFPTRVQQVHKLQVRKPSSTKEYSPTQQASKKRRGRATLGRMGNLATCATNAANPEEQQEFFGFEPGDPFPLGAFEKYANDFKEQYFRKPQEQQSTTSEKKWEPTIEMIEGEYWRIVEQATDQIEVCHHHDSPSSICVLSQVIGMEVPVLTIVNHQSTRGLCIYGCTPWILLK